MRRDLSAAGFVAPARGNRGQKERIVIPEPINTAEADPARGPRSLSNFYLEMNGNPYTLGFGTGVLERLAALGYDIRMVQPHTTGQTLHEQAAEYAQAFGARLFYEPAARVG